MEKPKSISDNPNANQRGIYYGWVMVLLAAVAMAATLPGRTHGLGLVTQRLLADLQLSPTQFGHMNLWATLLGAAFCLPCGWLIDRIGVRWVTGMVLLALGLSVVWLSQVTNATQLFVAITLTRGFGQSMLSVVSITMVGKWFSRRLGPAMGVYSVLMSVTMALSAGAIGGEIIRLGWRDAWWQLGLGLIFLAPVYLLAARNAPADPSREFPVLAEAKSPDTLVGATLTQALGTQCFWIFSLSISFFGLVSAGLSLFNQGLLEEQGFSESVYHRVLVIGMLTGMTANLTAGWLAKVVPLQRLLSVALLLLAAALAWFPFIRSLTQVYAYALIYGVAGGMLTVLFFAIWGHAFGAARLGRIQAAAQMLTVFASAAGPLVVAASREATGSYVQIFSASAVIAATLSLASWFTPVPQAQTWAKPSPVPSAT